MTALRMFIPLTKIDEEKRLVYGSLASEVEDKAGEVFDYERSKPNVQKWSDGIAKATDGKSLGNLRYMHQADVVGKFTDVTCNDATKSVDVCAYVSDDKRWGQVVGGELTGFSIGGKYVAKWEKDGKKFYEADPSEGSLVDNPANPASHFSMVKSDGAEELRKFHPKEGSPETPELEQVWKAKDGKTFATKADAKTHNEALSNPVTQALAELSSAVGKAAQAQAAPVTKRDVSDDERAKLADEGKAMADGSYPIANKTDLENAVKAFGRAKNKKAVKAHIIKRAKALGAEGSLPDSWKPGAEKALRFGDLRKGLYGVARLAGLIEELEWLQQSTEYEAEMEGDKSPVPDEIKQSIASLCACLRAMVEEETNELLDEEEMLEFGEMLEMSARTHGVNALAKVLGAKAPKGLAKVGARHSKGDKEHLNAAHDHLTKMGAGCAHDGYDGKEAEKEYKEAAAGGSLGKAGARHSAADMGHLNTAHEALKAAGAECPGGESKCMKDMQADDTSEPAGEHEPSRPGPSGPSKVAESDLQKRLDDERTKHADFQTGMVATLKELTAKVQKIADQPMPRPGEFAVGGDRFRVIAKDGTESGAPLANDEATMQERLLKMSEDERARFFINLARATGKAITR